MTKKIFVNFPVIDLKASMAFYEAARLREQSAVHR